MFFNKQFQFNKNKKPKYMKNQFYRLKFSRFLILIISILLIGSKQLKAQVNTYTFTQSSGTFTTINNLAGTVNLTTVGSGTYDDAA